MNKKLISIILILLMMPSCISSLAADNNGFEPAVSYEAVSFIDGLGIIDKSFYEYGTGQYLTRAELARLSVELMGVELDYSEAQNRFSDVSPDSPYAHYINMANVLGILSGTGKGQFSPDSLVYMDQILKVVLSVMGYRDWATAKGGYPGGYRIAASSFGITDGMSFDFSQPASRGDILKVVYNALTVDLMITDVYTTDGGNFDNFEYHIAEGENILTKYHKIKCIEGIVDADSECSLYKEGCGEGCIGIDGKIYKLASGNITGYIGKAVEAYLNADKEVLHIREKDNYEYFIDAADIYSYSPAERAYYISAEDSRKISLSDNFNIIYNNYGLDGSEPVDFNALLNPGKGYIRLIDNNGDKLYDYVIIEDSKIVVFASYDSYKEVIYDKLSRSYDVSLKSYSDYRVKYADSDDNTLSDLKSDTVLMLYESIDKKHAVIEVCSGAVNSVIDEVSSDKRVFILGKEYGFAANARHTDNLKPGTSYSIYLDKHGKIVYFNYSDQKMYGYIVGTGTIGSGLDSSYGAKLISENGTISDILFASKVSVEDGGNISGYSNEKLPLVLSNAMARLYPAASYSSVHIYVSYKIKDGKISYIGLPYVIDNEADFVNPPSACDFFRLDYLVSYASADGNLKYTPKNHSIGSIIAIKDDCPVYFVPEFSEGIAAFTDDSYGLRLSSSFTSGKEFKAVYPFTGAANQMEVYSTDREVRIAEAVVYTGTQGYDETITEGYNNNCLVTEITSVMDGDGGSMYAIDIIENGKEKTIYAEDKDAINAVNLKPSFSGNNASIRYDKQQLEAGDVIKYSLKPNGRVNKIALMYDEKGKDICYKTDRFTAYDDQYRYTSGTVLDVFSGYALMSLHQSDPSDYKNEMLLCSLFERVYVYNCDTSEASIGSEKDISIGDRVYVSCNNRIPKEVIVFKGGSR